MVASSNSVIFFDNRIDRRTKNIYKKSASLLRIHLYTFGMGLKSFNFVIFVCMFYFKSYGLLFINRILQIVTNRNKIYLKLRKFTSECIFTLQKFQIIKLR